jgi:hypothetical protein
MVKLTEQDIPPELADLYAEYVSPMGIDGSGTGNARTRRKVRRGRSPDAAKQALAGLRAAARYVVRRAISHGAELDERMEIREELSRIARGIFSEAYWMLTEIPQTKSLHSIPTSAAITQPERYLYPDPSNQPTTPTYPAGTTDANAGYYHGATSAGLYADLESGWYVALHDLLRDTMGTDIVPVLLHISGSINIDASDRSCRAARSLVWKAELLNAAQDGWADNAFPFAGAPDTWPTRKELPDSAPYGQLSQTVTLIRNLTHSAHYVRTGSRYLKTSVAPLPMWGYMYNNNTSITTDWEGDESVYVPWFAPDLQLTISRSSSTSDISWHKINGYPFESKTVFPVNVLFPGGVTSTIRSWVTLGPRNSVMCEWEQTRIYAQDQYTVKSKSLEPMIVDMSATTDQYWDVVICEFELQFTTVPPAETVLEVMLISQRWFASGETIELSRHTESRTIASGGADYMYNLVQTFPA